MSNRGARWRRPRRLGPCWCGRAGHAVVDGRSPDGLIEFVGWPACVDHQFPERWPANVWDGIRDYLSWDDAASADPNACPFCALPHGPLTTCDAFRAVVAASWPYRAPTVN